MRDMSLDEEYMRQILCAADRAEKNPAAAELLAGPVQRTFARSPRLASTFLQTLRQTMIQNKEGILMPAFAWKPDWPRIERVLRKIGRGLFYHFMGRRLASDAIVEVLPQLNQETFDIIAKTIKDAQNVGPFQLGNRAVIFGGGRNSDKADETVWLISFYETHSAVVWTTSKARAEHDASVIQGFAAE
jgi:hypothetical protein